MKRRPNNDTESTSGIKLGWQANFVILAWSYSGAMLAVSAMVFCYAGFYWNAINRLNDPYLRSRMYVVARLLQPAKTGSSGKASLPSLQCILDEASSKSVQGSRHDPNFLLVWKGNAEELKQIDAAREIIANTQPPDYEFTANIKALSRLLKGVVEHDSKTYTNRFQLLGTDSFRFNGIDFREPSGDMAVFKEDVRNYLVYRDMFNGHFAQTPLGIKLAPWKLIKFYDVIRFDLNDTIPLAFGTLLLACAFFLEFRFCDYRSPWRAKKGKSLCYRDFWQPESPMPSRKQWVPLWNESKSSPATSVSMFRNQWLPRVGAGMLLLGLVIEFGFNTPEKRDEWIINTPVQIGMALAMTFLWITLWDMGRLEINPELRRFSSDFRRKMFRPLLFGAGCLAVSSVWGAIYSVFELAPFSTGQAIRAGIQVVMSFSSLWLLSRLMLKLNQKLTALGDEGGDRVSESIEKELNLPDEASFFTTLVPSLDEKVLKASLIVLLPLPSFVQSFFSR